uniref:Major facilitator superfamily (MFS) profile domain-containing protein n=1 Tax=Octactis speculum TaxID=3111310 RepID=A0A7S2GKN7_9STRA
MHARFIEFSALSAGAFSLLMFWWMGRDRRFYVIAIAQTAWSVIIAIGSSCVAAFEVEFWSGSGYTYTGVALGHSIAYTLFGGLVPTVATFMYDFWSPFAPFVYISTLTAISLTAHVVRRKDLVSSLPFSEAVLVTGDNENDELISST